MDPFKDTTSLHYITLDGWLGKYQNVEEGPCHAEYKVE